MATSEVTLNRRRLGLTIAHRWLSEVPVIPVILLSPLVICGIFGEFLYPHEPHAINLSMSFMPPAFIPGGNPSYFLGTDQLGRDLLSRLIEGARPSLLVALFGVIISGIIGVILGMVSGYFGGKTDNVIMRIVDIWMSIPALYFMLMLVAMMRQIEITGLGPIIIAISLTVWVGYARVIRGEILSLKQRDFVALARVTGCGNFRVLVKHIFPNILNTLVVISTMQLGGCIMMEAGMSFLGVGIQPPNTAWGLLISESRSYMSSAWWIPAFSGLAITMTILGANLLGDWLRDILDPKL